MATCDYFLKIDGIEGESQDHKHKGEIHVLSWSKGVTNSGTFAEAGGGGAGKATWHDATFTYKIDKSYPKLKLAAATGEHIKKAVLTCRKAGKEQQEFFKITFEDLLVSSVHLGGSGESDVVPVVQLSMNYAKVEEEYKEQKADGSLGGSVKYKYDLKGQQKG